MVRSAPSRVSNHERSGNDSSQLENAPTTQNRGHLVEMVPILFSTTIVALESAAKQPHDQQQHDGADRRIDDLRYKTCAEMDAEPRKQQAGDQRAGDTDDNIADDPKAGAPHHLSGQPARDQADE